MKTNTVLWLSVAVGLLVGQVWADDPNGPDITEPNLVLCYTLDTADVVGLTVTDVNGIEVVDANGATVVDQSGNGNDGTIVGDDVIVGAPGVFNEGMQFPGDFTRNRVEVAAGIVPSGAASRAISLWFSHLGMFEGRQSKIFGYGARSAGNALDVSLEDGGIRIRHWGGNITYGSDYDFLGKDAGFHHLLVQVDANSGTFEDVSIYLDGQQLAVTAMGGGGAGVPIDTFDSAFAIGSGENNHDFYGILDEVRIYDRVLSEAEIAALSNENPDLLLAYSMDTADIMGVTVMDVNGTEVVDANGATVVDLSGNGNDGTIVGDDVVIGVPGVANEALQFPGDRTRDRVEVAAGVVPVGAAERAFSLWFSQVGIAANNNQPKLIGYGARAAGQALDVSLEGGGIRIRHWGGNITYGSDFDFVGKDAGFHHLVVQVRAESGTFEDVEIYLDGQKLAVTATGGGGTGVPLDTQDSPFAIGSGENDRDFVGILDEVQVYNRPLSEDEIMALMTK